MRIVADRHIPYVTEAFADLGDITLVEGRGLSRDEVADADILLVRSVTPVTSKLISGTGVKFIASVTSGIEHVDVAYLKEKGIGFSYAPGSNARSVAHYVVAAVLCLAGSRKLRGRTLGIIGVGNVGGLVRLYAESLGMRCVLNDPPKSRESGKKKYRPLEEVLEASDIVTLHVPLEKQGSDPTFHLVDVAFLLKMKPGSILINTSRGRVIDDGALKKSRERLGGLVLDVWYNEPRIDPEMCGMADIATPHIAGYSYDGKVQGTVMIQKAAYGYFRKKSRWDPHVLLSEPAGQIDAVTAEDPVSYAVQTAYPIKRDDEAIRRIIPLDPERREEGFDALRTNYPKRPEFVHFSVQCSNRQAADAEIIEKLGFSVKAS